MDLLATYLSTGFCIILGSQQKIKAIQVSVLHTRVKAPFSHQWDDDKTHTFTLTPYKQNVEIEEIDYSFETEGRGTVTAIRSKSISISMQS